MLSQVVSRVRLHFRRSRARLQQPPDLRRFSDFDNPFPRVSPGGYTRYYEKHGMPEPRLPAEALPTASSSTLVISTPIPRGSSRKSSSLSMPSSPSQSSSFSSQSSPPFTSVKRKRARTLSIVHEGSAGSITCSPSIGTRSPPNTPSLRRRRARLFHTPSVERHFPATAPKMTLLVEARIHNFEFSSNESLLESHSSRTDDSINTPPSSVESVEKFPLLFKIEELSMTPEPNDRPASMSSYMTARSNFTDH